MLCHYVDSNFNVTVCFLVIALLKPQNKGKKNKFIGKSHNSKTSYLLFGIGNKIIVQGANNEYTRPSCFGPKKGIFTSTKP